MLNMAKEKLLPNIIFFVADELRGDCVSFDGRRNLVIKTPNIDKLAKDGVAFTNADLLDVVLLRVNMYTRIAIGVFTSYYSRMKKIFLSFLRKKATKSYGLEETIFLEKTLLNKA